MLVFIVNVSYDKVKNIKGCTLSYLSQAKYDSPSEIGENNKESLIFNIPSKTEKMMLKYYQLFLQ